ncbi:MAG: hypothetical protein HPY68_06660 [Candidatus Atribacteria bacterium]|nr:hypothetical protein [Candidatus Atribacteria bacterium]
MKRLFLVCVFLVFVFSSWVLAEEQSPGPLVLPDATVIDTERSAPPAILGPESTIPGETRSGLPSLSRPETSSGLPSIGGTPSTGTTPESSPGAPAPGGLLPNLGGQEQTQPGGITITPPSPQVTIRWKQFDLGQAFGYNPLIMGVVEYPEGWLTNVDVFNKMVVFAEDATGLVALNAYLAIQNPMIQTAEDLAQQVVSMLSQSVGNLAIQSQDFKSAPKVAQYGLSVTYGRVILSGNYQGRNTTIILQPYVMYAPMAKYSLAGVILCYAPQEVFQDKLQKYFNHMIASFEALAQVGPGGGNIPQIGLPQ